MRISIAATLYSDTKTDGLCTCNYEFFCKDNKHYYPRTNLRKYIRYTLGVSGYYSYIMKSCELLNLILLAI